MSIIKTALNFKEITRYIKMAEELLPELLEIMGEESNEMLDTIGHVEVGLTFYDISNNGQEADYTSLIKRILEDDDDYELTKEALAYISIITSVNKEDLYRLTELV